MSYAEELLKDAENWVTPQEFKQFWADRNIMLGTAKIQSVLKKISEREDAKNYIRIFGSKKNRRVHKLKVLDFIMENS